MAPQDKTKEERLGDKLRSDTNRSQRLFDSMMDAFCEVDLSGRIINFNASFENLLGYTPDELRKLTYSDITPPKWHGFEAEIVEKEILAKGYSGIYEKEYRRKNGSVFPIELRSFLIKDDAGKPVSIWAIIRDISERKRTRDALRENEEKYRQLFNLANDAIFLMRKDALIDCNTKALEVFGCTREQIIGQPPERFFPPTQPDGKPSLEKAKEKIDAAIKGQPQFFEWVHVKYDGTPFPTEVSLNGITLRGEQYIQGLIRDISRRKEMEDSLRASEERFKTIFDNANDGILIADAETQKFILGNNKLSEMLGYEPKELRELGVNDIHPQESLSWVKDNFEKQRKGEIRLSENTPVLKKDGSVIFVDISAGSTQLSGKTYMIGIFRDNTDRKKFEEALRESEERLRDVVFSMADWVWEVDNKGVYTYSSIRSSDIFGVSPEEIIGKTPFDFMLPDEAKRIGEIFSGIVARKEPIKDLENWNIGKNGESICLLTNGVPILDKEGNLKGYRGVDKDITGRKRAEDLLRQTEARMRFALESSHTGYWDLDLVDHTAVRSIEHDRIFGYPELLPSWTYEQFLEHVLPEDRGEVAAKFQNAVENQTDWSFECRIMTLDKRVRWIYATGLRQLDGSGKVRRMAGIVQDITERKHAEKELTEAYEKLKQTHAQLVQSTKMASLGILAGGVAHEINNPLTGILNNVQLITLLAKEKKDFNLEEFKNILKDVEISALRCVNITQSLLNFSHASKGAFAPVCLNDAVRDILPLVEKELKLQNIVLRTEFRDDLPLMLGDVQLIEQVIFDMVNNARWAIAQHKDSREGSIVVKTALEPDKKRVSVSISDTGIGIPGEHLEKIFDPFFTTKEPGEGTGLGLSIAYNIVKSHYGDIEVKSERGKGTTFKLLFPVN